MEEGLSSLQLIPTRDIQSPTITTHQEASSEEQRRESSALGRSAQKSTKQHQRPEATEEQPRRVSAEEINQELVEIRRLGRLAEDLNRRLEWQDRMIARGNSPGSGFYPARYEQGRPLAMGATFEQEVQHPESPLYGHQGNAYGAYPNGAGLYGNMGNTCSVYPSGMWNMPRPEAYLPGRTDNAYSVYPNGVQHLSPDASMMEVNKVLLEQQQGNQPTETRNPATGKSVVQFCESATPGYAVTRPDTGSRQDTTMKASAEQTLEGGTTELEPAGTVYHTARTKRDDSSYRAEPVTEPELRTKERKVLQYDSEDSEDDDASDVRQHLKEKAETDAKAGATRHPPHQLHGTSKRASDPTDAKVGLTQHSPPKKSNSSSRSRTADRMSCQKK